MAHEAKQSETAHAIEGVTKICIYAKIFISHTTEQVVYTNKSTICVREPNDYNF